MTDLMPLVYLFAFMLIPLWIPMAAVIIGALADIASRGRKPSQTNRSSRTALAGLDVKDKTSRTHA